MHLNLSPTGLGRYGLLYGSALAATAGLQTLSIFDRRLLESPLLRSWAAGIEYRTLQLASSPQRLAGIAHLVAIAARFRPEVIHDSVGSSSPLGLIYLPLLARIAPLVITEHDPIPHIGMGRWQRSRRIRSFIRRRAARIVVHGTECRRMMIELGVPPERVVSEKHGHLAAFNLGQYVDVPFEPKTVLFFGALRPNKGVDWLLPIADRVKRRHPDARFLVAGSSRLSKDLQRSAWSRQLQAILAQMERQPQFEVHEGFIPDERIEYFFRRAGIVLLPYREATQSGVAMIAMPFAKPIIATDVGDIGEVVQDEVTGLLCQPQVESIAAAVNRLLDEPARAAALGTAARESALSDFDWKGIASRMLLVYASVAANRSDTP